MNRATPRVRIAHRWLFLSILGSLLSGACTAELGKDGGHLDDDDAASPDGMLGAGAASSDSPTFERLGGTEAITCDEGSAAFGSPRIWRLTRRQYDRTVAAILLDDSQPARDFLPEPGSEQGFQNDAYQLRVRQTEAGQFQSAAKSLAAAAVATHLDALFPCAADQLENEACKSQFVEEFGARAFRRTLTDDEVTRYLALYDHGQEKGDGALGLTVTIEAMLQSPHFLYRFELGGFDPSAPGPVTLTSDEIAAALSYYLTDGPPDDALLAAAQTADLGDAEERERQATRLVATDAGREAALEFYRQLFEYSGLDEVMKDSVAFPDFDELRPYFHTEMDQFTEHVLFDDTGTLDTLLTAEYTFVNRPLGEFLGLATSSDGFEQTSVNPEQRAGILSLAGFNAALSAQTRTSPVNRGRFVRDKLLCEHIEDPPAGVDTSLPTLDEGMTAREQLEAKTSAPSCAGCHSVMNPLGFGMEALDAIGRYRTEENGLPIDDDGELVGTRDIDGPFSGTPELGHRLAASEQVKECFAVQSYRYAFGRGENTGDACALVRIRDAFISAGGDLSALARVIAASDEFIQRDGGR